MANIPVLSSLVIDGTLTVETIAAGITDYDRFLVSDGGVIKYRTGAEVLSDIGASSQTLTLGTDNQIPIMKAGGTDFEYSANWAFDSATGTLTLPTTFTMGLSTGSQTYNLFTGANTSSSKIINIGSNTPVNGTVTVNLGSVASTTGTINLYNKVVLGTLDAGITDYDKFLVSDAGTIKYRTGAQVLFDIGAASSSHTHTFDSLTSKTSGTGNYTTTGNFTALRLISTQATGTAPLTVSSTTLVSNLNADLWDGYDIPTGFASTANPFTIIATGEWDLPVGGAIFSQITSVGGPGAAGYWFMTGRRDAFGGYSGIYTSYNGGDSWIGSAENNTTNPTWHRILTDANASTQLTQFLKRDDPDTKTSGDLTFNSGVKINLAAAGDLWADGTNTYLRMKTGNLLIDDADVATRFTFGRTTGKLTATGDIQGSNIYATGNYFSFGSSTGEGEYLYRTGNHVRIYAGASAVFTADGDNGRVGINNTAPLNEFHINGSNTAPAGELGSFIVGGGTNARRLAFGVNSTSTMYSWIQSVENGLDSRALALNPNGGNVGIGETVPTSKLHLKGTTGIGQRFENSSLNLSTWISSESDRFQINSQQPINIAEQGTSSTMYLSAGKVGINNTSPLSRLHIQEGNTSIGWTNYADNLAIFEGTNDAIITIAATNTGQSEIWFADSDLQSAGRVRYEHSTNAMEFWTNGSEKLKIDSSGYVLLPNIGQSLYISGVTDAGNDGIRLHSGGDNAYFDVKGGVGLNFRINDVDGGAQHMRLNTSGNLSIGLNNNNNNHKLEASGAIFGTGDGNGVAFYMNSANAIRSSGTMYLDVDTSGGGGFTRVGSGDMIFRTANANQRMKINGSGNVSIGLNNNNDTYLLDVAGNGRFTGDLYINGDNIIMNGGQTRVKYSLWTDADTYGMGFGSTYSYGGLNNFATTFQMDLIADRGWWWGQTAHTNAQGAMALTNAGLLTVASYTRIGYGVTDATAPGSTYMLQVNGIIEASNFKLSSDKRLKKNIETYTTKPINVHWKNFILKNDEKEEIQLGVIAQDLEKSHPEFVTTGDDGLKSVDYIQLLIAKNAELEDRITKLESLIKKLI